jgi:hypothetical protein
VDIAGIGENVIEVVISPVEVFIRGFHSLPIFQTNLLAGKKALKLL